MEEVASLLDLLQAGESALAVLTDGRNLKLKRDGSGTSGYWVIDPARQVDRFIIYCREGGAGDTAQLYRGDYVSTEPSTEDAGRYAVTFEGAKQVGVTRLTWPKFADTGSNPVRYISRPATEGSLRTN